MVVIRLARGGSKKRPFYNVVVTDSRMRRDSHSIERLGYYNPVAAGADVRLHFEEDRVNYWLSKGAQMRHRGPPVQEPRRSRRSGKRRSEGRHRRQERCQEGRCSGCC